LPSLENNRSSFLGVHHVHGEKKLPSLSDSGSGNMAAG